MVMVSWLVYHAPSDPVTMTVNVYVPGAVGVPPMTPPADRVSPGGSQPDTWDQVYGPIPPLAVRVCEYADPSAPDGRLEMVISGAMTAWNRMPVLSDAAVAVKPGSRLIWEPAWNITCAVPLM